MFSFLRNGQFAGLEAVILPEKTVFYFVLVRRKAQRLELQRSAGPFENIAEIQAQLSPQIPVQFVISGKGILHRRIAADPALETHLLLPKILPNASLRDFYLQSAPAGDNQRWVSLVRAAVADELIAALRAKNIFVLGCTLGPFALHSLFPHFDAAPALLQAGHHELRFSDETISGMQFSETFSTSASVRIGGQEIDTAYLSAFAAVFQSLLPGEEHVLAPVPALHDAVSEFRDRKIFRNGSRLLLVMTLLVLLVNFFLWGSARQRLASLEERASGETEMLARLHTLEKQVESRREFLGKTGLANEARYAWYADRLAADLPAAVRLTRLEISPRLHLAEDDTIGFRNREIEIAGSSPQSLVLNEWIRKLKDYEWVVAASLRSYVQDKAGAPGSFELQLKTR